jgi:hypothetical protein
LTPNEKGKKRREKTNLRLQVIVMKLFRKKSSDPTASVERQQQLQQQNTNAKTKNERNSDKHEGERERERSARGSLFQRSRVPNA